MPSTPLNRTAHLRKPAPPAAPVHVIWDWNGTLFDDAQACVNTLNILLRERGLAGIGMEDYRERFGFPVRDFYRTLGFDLPAEDWETLARRFHTLYLADGTAVVPPAARAALAWMKKAQIRQSVLSACEQTILTRLLLQHRLSGTFDHVQGTDNLDGRSKIEVGRRLVAVLGLPTDRLLLIGDTLHDAEVAEALGCRCLLIADGHQTRHRLTRSGCPVLDSLRTLPDWWKTQGGGSCDHRRFATY